MRALAALSRFVGNTFALWVLALERRQRFGLATDCV